MSEFNLDIKNLNVIIKKGPSKRAPISAAEIQRKQQLYVCIANYFVDAFLGETMKTLDNKLYKEGLTLVERNGDKL